MIAATWAVFSHPFPIMLALLCLGAIVVSWITERTHR